jgi:hypothetical protein
MMQNGKENPMSLDARLKPMDRWTTALTITAILTAVLLYTGCSSSSQLGSGGRETKKITVVYQPSHQSDTGVNFNEALVCNGIVEAAMAASTGVVNVYKVWSYDVDGLHHARQGSNTKVDHTTAVDSLGRISGYAHEIIEANKLHPDVFIAVHNNGATNRNACWGYVHEGDAGEQRNRDLAKEFVEEICRVSGLENRGVLGDSSPNRNDYRCKNTGKLSFYSVDENINVSPVRVLLEIGDNKVSYDLLMDPAKQKLIGQTIQAVVERRFGKAEN